MDKLESQQKKNTERLETIFEQTGKLTAGQADIYAKLEDISENIDYLTTKEAVNERETSKLKKRAQ